jgi:hypothetical protein
MRRRPLLPACRAPPAPAAACRVQPPRCAAACCCLPCAPTAMCRRCWIAIQHLKFNISIFHASDFNISFALFQHFHYQMLNRHNKMYMVVEIFIE